MQGDKKRVEKTAVPLTFGYSFRFYYYCSWE